jgi:hypothetical protein
LDARLLPKESLIYHVDDYQRSSTSPTRCADSEKDIDYSLVTYMSLRKDVPVRLSLAILSAENAGHDHRAVHLNENGTKDLGLFQINDRYLFTKFIPAYWDLPRAFDPFAPEDNIYIAVSHLKYLLTAFGDDVDKAIMAYNAGEGAVMRGAIPPSTHGYHRRVKATMLGA